MRRVNRRTAQRLQNRNPSPSALVSRILSEKNKRATCSRTAHSGRIVGYSYLIPVTSPATRAGDSTMGLETASKITALVLGWAEDSVLRSDSRGFAVVGSFSPFAFASTVW